MLLILVGLLLGVPILWTVSVGAVREARRAKRLDPRAGCQAWVAVPGVRGRLYRCCEPVYAGGSWCRPHEVVRAGNATDVDSDAAPIDEPQAVGRALAQARIGVPLALVALLGTVALIVWAIQHAA